MRFVLKVLAVLCALICGLMVVVGVGLTLSLWGTHRIEAMPLGGKVAMFGTFILMGTIGACGVVWMVRHLRRPDATTARQVCIVVLFLFTLQLINLIHGRTDRRTGVEWFGTPIETLGSIAAGLAMIAFYKFVAKELAARNYPPSLRHARRDENHPPSSGAAGGQTS